MQPPCHHWLEWLSGLVIALELKGHQFNSWSGHMPGLCVWSPVRALMRDNGPMFLTSMFLSLAFPLPSPPLSYIYK